MEFYFKLQFRRIKRILLEFGLHPILGCLLGIIGFIVASKFLFIKTEYASFIYCFFALSTLSSFGEQQRSEQLKKIFKKKDFYRIRILENAIVVLPFFLYLCFEKAFLEAFGIAVFSPILVFFNSKLQLNRTIPTPFRRRPFEFIVGFRKTILLVFISYFLLLKSIQVGNFNLGLGALALLFLINMSYYFKPEQLFFVWIFNTESASFLRKKITNAIYCSTILTAPILIGLTIVFPSNWLFILGVQLLGYVFLSSMILSKYSAYPREMSVPQAVLYGLSLWFPPMLLLVIPIFYKQSKRSLKPILE